MAPLQFSESYTMELIRTRANRWTQHFLFSTRGNCAFVFSKLALGIEMCTITTIKSPFFTLHFFSFQDILNLKNILLAQMDRLENAHVLDLCRDRPESTVAERHGYFYLAVHKRFMPPGLHSSSTHY